MLAVPEGAEKLIPVKERPPHGEQEFSSQYKILGSNQPSSKAQLVLLGQERLEAV